MMEIKKTGYHWCLEANIRLLGLGEWGTEQSYYTEKIDAKTFYDRIGKCKVKPNSTPRKTEMYLEYRMYGLVPYNLSPIQQGIQFGHAVVEYGRAVKDIHIPERIYNKWADIDKTFIILNGGTTNDREDYLGTLQVSRNSLIEEKVLFSEFREPDLNDALTGVVFLVDERVFNRTLYPDFVGNPYPWGYNKKPTEKQFSKWEAENTKNYESWVEKIGGKQNAFLREFLRGFKLA